MAEIRPFRGIRFNPRLVGPLSNVVAPPYDIISPTAQVELHSRSPFNVVRLELGFESAADGPPNNRYTRAAAEYRSWFDRGVIGPESEPGFYVYDEEFSLAGAHVSRRSLVAVVRLARWEENVVLPHEHTLPRAKADRLQLLTATHTQFSPLLAIYDDPGAVRETLAAAASGPPDLNLDLEPGALAAAARHHRIWRLNDAQLVKALVAAVDPLRLFIADGHHRYETALAYRDARRQHGAKSGAPSDYVLMHLVEANDPGLVVLPTHRIIRGLGQLDRSEVLRRLSENFRSERISLRESPPPVTFAGAPPSIDVLGLTPDSALRVTVRPDVDLAQQLADEPPVLRGLDTLVLQRLILERALGLAANEAEAGERIQYTRDPDEASRAYVAGEAQLVFFLAPTPLSLIREAMRQGIRMPQKTTYFYPKPITGLVFFDHDVPWGEAS